MQVNTKSKKSHIIKSYAKVNIGLNIIDKMQNGYHEIETLIQQVDFYDTIEIKIGSQAGDVIFSTSGNAINCENEKNSCVMITKLLRQKFKIYNNITIKLHKNIPIGAGLGGGSSNAAAILNFMNHYFKLNLDYNKKVNLCQTIGMDAPFFIDGKLQYAENMGWLLDEAMDRVHKSNMSKLDEDGNPIYREDGKVLKGPNYKPPDLSDLF